MSYKKRLSKFIPHQAKRLLLSSYDWLLHQLMKACASNRFFAGVYYCFLSRRFDREHLAVLSGRIAYKKSLSNIGNSSPMLRRNIHRLEKGLIMKPLRPIFAEDYIIETVRFYKQACKKEDYSAEELKWAGDVLEEYFSVVKSSTIIDEARREHKKQENQGINDLNSRNAKGFRPYPLANSINSNISFDDLLTLFMRR